MPPMPLVFAFMTQKKYIYIDKGAKTMLINGENYFNDMSLKNACAALEKGETIDLYVDCIGHTRNNTVQEEYKEALTEKYGDNLTSVKNKGAFSYYYSYKLKKAENEEKAAN